MNQKIRLLIMDVDGTLTNGKIYISQQGELFKAFNVKDGHAIKNILPAFNIIPVIITGRVSDIVSCRCKELGIQYLHQGINDKAACLRDLAAKINVPLKQIACIGDDVNDLPMMKICGLKGCPSDAVPEVQTACDYICKTSGGHGAVREFAEWLIALEE